MADAPATPSAAAAAASALVVLLTCETLGDHPDPLLLRHTIDNAASPVRVLMLVTRPTGLAFAKRLAEAGVPVELLLGSEVTDTQADLPFARMPPHSKPDDRDEFALALADVLMADPAAHRHRLAHRAMQLGKPVIAPGKGLPTLTPIPSVTRDLDPEALDRHAWRRRVAGRLEQGLLELLSFGLFASDEGSFRDRLARLRKSLRSQGKWPPSSYFAPARCRDLAPDPRAFRPSSPLVARFEALDRSAVLGAYIHRDLIWLAHFGAAGAVLLAVLGATLPVGHLWAIMEFVLLAVVALLVFLVRRSRLQDRWMACRLGAEQLRIARMCLPLLVVQRALISEDTWPGRAGPADAAAGLTGNALSEVKRAIRDQGLPLRGHDCSPVQAARWVDCIVADQILYHQLNRRKLARAEGSLRRIAALLFFAAIVAVLAELAPALWACFPRLDWLLLVTAAGPAFAGAFHGAATRLGIVHRVALSEDVERELVPIHAALTEIIGRPTETDESWAEIRDLAFRAAEAMGRENQSWHGLVRLQRDTLPA
jgi:hypothetical protein